MEKYTKEEIKENRKKVLTKYNQKTYIENIKKLFSKV